MNANKKMVQSQLSCETGQVILLKDLSNVATAAKRGASRKSIESVVATLKDKYGEWKHSWHDKVTILKSDKSMYMSILLGASVGVYCDYEQNLKGLFFQDQHMIDTFKAYPELHCIDATYKLVELRLQLYNNV